tara:strand:- start:13822 stop:14313 length:492 start_codon:yes stop_codon:yes gene_type:complete
MSELLAKISSYNIFNYLLPGVLFVAFAKIWTGFSFVQDNLVIAAFVYYFIGMVISRIGSILVEPILKKFGFLNFAEYADFVRASAKDAKIETLSEANNSYRTLCALFISLLFLKLFDVVAQCLPFLSNGRTCLLLGSLFLLFLFSYRKQTSYITKRIRANLDS